MKIIVDTNFFLDFYRQGQDHLDALDYMITNGHNIIFPEQVYIEFQRNMLNVQNVQLKAFKNQYPTSTGSTSRLIRELPEFKDFLEKQENFNKSRNIIVRKIEEIIADPSKSNVYQVVEKVYRDDNVKVIKITDQIIDKAKNRHLLGNPPGSGKTIIGDQVVWESILAHANDDIALVTNDHSFIDNFFFLKNEFRAHTNFELKIFKSLSDAIKALGDRPSDSLIEYESKQKIEFQGEASFDYTNNDGLYTIGKGEYSFDTKWTTADRTSVHAYKDGANIEAIGFNNKITQFPDYEHVDDLIYFYSIFDFTSRVRTPSIGQMVAWKNSYGKYAFTRIRSVEVFSRGDTRDWLTFDYIIYS